MLYHSSKVHCYQATPIQCVMYDGIDDVPLLDEQLDSLFKVVHVGPLPTSIQSLLLLYQVMEGRQAVSARYYRALYQKLLDTQLAVHSAQQVVTVCVTVCCNVTLSLAGYVSQRALQVTEERS